MLLEIYNHIVQGNIDEFTKSLKEHPELDINTVFPLNETSEEQTSQPSYDNIWAEYAAEREAERRKAEGTYYRTLLTAAIEHGQADIEDLLLTHPNIVLDEPFRYWKKPTSEHFATPLLFAIKHNKMNSIRKLLDKNKNILETVHLTETRTPKYDDEREIYHDALLFAINVENIQAFELLIEAGVIFNRCQLTSKFKKNNNGKLQINKIYRSPLTYSVELRRTEFVEMLLRLGVSPMEKTLSVISHDNTKIYRSALETYSYFSSMRFQKKVDNNLLKILLSTYPGIRNYCRVTSDLSLANQTTDLKDYQLVPNKKLYIDYPFLLMSMNPKQGRSLTEINPKRSIFRLLRHIKAPSLNVSQSLNPHNSWLLLRFVSIETSKSSTLLRPQREKFFMIGQTALT